jgi:hypothetical protein
LIVDIYTVMCYNKTRRERMILWDVENCMR